LHQVSTAIWNDIAAQQPLSIEWRPFFECKTAEELRQAWDGYWRRIPRAFDNRVQRAFEVVGPLLFENEAISDYIVENDRIDLRTGLPELLSPEEAAELASLEFQLDADQLAELRSMLSAPLDLSSALRDLRELKGPGNGPPRSLEAPPRLPRSRLGAHQQLTTQIAKDCGRRLAIRAIKHLRSLPAQLSGEDSRLTNVWEEYCVQVQGEESYFWHSYVDTVKDAIRSSLRTVRLLELTAMWLQTREGHHWLAENKATDATHLLRRTPTWLNGSMSWSGSWRIPRSTCASCDSWLAPQLATDGIDDSSRRLTLTAARGG